MVKKIIGWLIALAVILGLICTIKFFSNRLIFAFQVDRIEFQGQHACDAPASTTIELNKEEAQKLLSLYNLSVFSGLVNAEGCEHRYGYTIYLNNGEHIQIMDSFNSKAEVEAPQGQFLVKGKSFSKYADQLIEKYSLDQS